MSAARDGENSFPCRNGTQSLIFEVRHQERLKDFVLAQDLGALCGVVVEGMALRGYLLLLFGGEFGGIGGSRTSGGAATGPRATETRSLRKGRSGPLVIR
ncbi:MAG: hypothetical protein WAM02_00995 [Candidatus Cybelea sp.]